MRAGVSSNRPAKDPNVGRMVAGKYRIDAAVGAGANGTVYRASHLSLERVVALKVLNPALLTNDAARGRFRREARAASKLDHPNSVKVLDYGSEPDGLTYLAMEFLEGRELYRVIYEDWPMGTERTVRVMSEVLNVLSAAHELGVVHRDLKPENIMLVHRPGPAGKPVETVKVADFGIAKSFAGPVSEESLNLTRDGAVPGTPEYMSPEHARGEEIDGRADLYACGVILYEMVTGTLPFSGEGPIEVILKQLNEAPEKPSLRRPDADRRLESVIMRSLEKDRRKRFQTASEMLNALRAAAAQPRDETVAYGGERAQPTRHVVRDSVATLVSAVAPPADTTLPPSPSSVLGDGDDVAMPLVRPSGHGGARQARATLTAAPERTLGYDESRPAPKTVSATTATDAREPDRPVASTLGPPRWLYVVGALVALGLLAGTVWWMARPPSASREVPSAASTDAASERDVATIVPSADANVHVPAVVPSAPVDVVQTVDVTARPVAAHAAPTRAAPVRGRAPVPARRPQPSRQRPTR